MNGREMNDSSGRGRDRRRSGPRRAAALAAMALTCLLLTACGGGSPPAASATGGSASATGGDTRVGAALAYARCMRSHGVPDFPDPDGSGDFHLGNSVSSQETAANHVCNHLLNVGTQLNAAQKQHALRQLVKYAQCMRAHGVPGFPDPQITNGGVGVPGGFTFDTAGAHLNQKSPQYQSAARACQHLATHAKG